MKVKTFEGKPGWVVLDVEAQPVDVDRAFDIAQLNYCQQRGIALSEGKTPTEAAFEQRGVKDLDALCAPLALAALLPFALDASGVFPAFLPEPPAGVCVQRGKTAAFRLDVMVRPAFELTSYDPLVLEVYPFTYDTQAVDDQILQLARQYATYENSPEQRPLAPGDAASISFSCSIDGTPIDRLTCEHRIYLVSSGVMPEDFDRNVVGMEPGETKTFTFEATDHEGLSLEMRAYEGMVTVHALQIAHIPQINDAWVAANVAPYTTLAQLKDALATQLDSVRRAQYDDYVRSVAATELAKRFTGMIPEPVLEGAARTFLADLRQQVASQGMRWEDFVVQSGGQDNVNKAVVTQTLQTLKECYALDALFSHEHLTATDADMMDVCAQVNPQNPVQARAMMEEQGFGYTLRESAHRYRANCWLVEHAIIKHIEEPDRPQAYAPEE